jgi:cyanate lyase
LSPEAVDQLQMVPYKGSLPSTVPTDPLIYRFYELIMVYGIMSAIDFSMDISRVEDPKGDRVKIVLNGKFLPYKMY